MRTGVLGVIALGLLTAACGTTQEQRAATGGLTGLGVGALVGGPVGAAVGLAAGAAGGVMMPEDATSIANNMLGREHHAANDLLNGNRTASNERATEGSGSSVEQRGDNDRDHDRRGIVRAAQERLQNDGYYKGQIDGIDGRQTHAAIRAFQQHEGLQQTARLDRATMDRLDIGRDRTGAAPANTNTAGAANGNYNANSNATAAPAGSGSSVQPNGTQPNDDQNTNNGGANYQNNDNNGANDQAPAQQH